MSESAGLLRKTVAEFFEVDEGQVGPSFSLIGPRGASSITRAALDAAIRRRVGLRSRSVYSARTFGEIEAELAPGASNGATEPPPEAARAPSPSTNAPAPAGAIACGVDMELVANLPAAADAWEDAFYRATFTGAEIAYCLAQPEPPLHFCARWCAKEALRKCDPAFLNVDLNRVEVGVESSGAPFLASRDGSAGPASRLPHALSLSHTTLAAVAVVVRADLPAPPAPALAPPPAPAPVVVEVPTPQRRRLAPALFALLTLAAFGMAALALWRTWPHAG